MKLINPVSIVRILSSILLIEAASFLACIPVSVIYSEPLMPFLVSSLVTGLLAGLMRLISRNY